MGFLVSGLLSSHVFAEMNSGHGGGMMGVGGMGGGWGSGMGNGWGSGIIIGILVVLVVLVVAYMMKRK